MKYKLNKNNNNARTFENSLSFLKTLKVTLLFTIIIFSLSSCADVSSSLTQTPELIESEMSALFEENAILDANIVSIDEEVSEIVVGESITTLKAAIDLDLDSLREISAIEPINRDTDVSTNLDQQLLGPPTGNLVFIRKLDMTNGQTLYQIRVHNLTNGSKYTLHWTTNEIQSVAINGDGSLVVASMQNPSTGSFDIYLFNVPARTVSNVSGNTNQDELNVSITRYGSKIAWQREDILGQSIMPFVCTYVLFTNSCEKLESLGNIDDQIQPSLSANGAYLVYVRIEFTRKSIWRYRFLDGSNVLVASTVINNNLLKNPSIDDSGNKVLYSFEDTTNNLDFVMLKDISSNANTIVFQPSSKIDHPFMAANAEFLTYESPATTLPNNVVRTYDIGNNISTLVEGGSWWDYSQPSLMTSSTCGHNSHNVTTGSITITNQSDIDALANVNKINGQLWIRASHNLDFSPLSQLTETNDFGIWKTHGLTNLAGFDCLKHVRRFAVDENTSLVNLSGFSALETSDNFIVEENSTLISLPNFDSLKHSDRMYVSSNPVLVTSPKFRALETANSIEYLGNLSLARIGDFNNLVSVADGIGIFHNDSLFNISFFPKLSTIGSLRVVGNPLLRSIDGFHVLSSADSIKIVDNDTLVRINAFANLAIINSNSGSSLFVALNQSLKTISGFQALSKVVSFDILSNPSLHKISGFQALSEITEKMRIQRNDVLTNLPMFPALTQIGHRFSLEQNLSLVSVDGFNALQTVGDEFQIHDNDRLEQIDGFSSLSSVGNNFRISNNAIVKSFNFNDLNTVDGKLEIVANLKLIDLNDFTLPAGNILSGISVVSYNKTFDCVKDPPSFAPVTTSEHNKIDCP